MPPKVISIANNKGGTGKTTVSVMLSIALAKLGYRVLLLDNDTQCNATKLLTHGASSHRYSMYDLITEPENFSMDKAILTNFPPLYLVPNIIDTSGLSLGFSQDIGASLTIMDTALRQISNDFDYVIIDCPPTLDIPMSMALAASDGVIVPVEVGSIHALDGVEVCLGAISEVQTINPRLSFLKIIMNRADMRTSVSKVMISDVKRLYPGQAFDTVWRICTAIQQAEYLRETLYEYAPRNNFLRHVKALAIEVASVMPVDKE